MTSRILAELKQTKPFPSIHGEAAVSILRTAAILDHATNEALKPFGLTNTQYNVLRILRGAAPDGLCGREVGERMIAPVPDVTRMLDRMEAADLVRRDRDPEDRRQVTIRITATGRKKIDEVAEALDAVERRFLSRVSAARLRDLVATLDDVRIG